MKIISISLLIIANSFLSFGKVKMLFSGSDLDAFEFAPNSWEIESDGSMVCRMKITKDKKGRERIQGMGYIWTENFPILTQGGIQVERGQIRESFIGRIRTIPFREDWKSVNECETEKIRKIFSLPGSLMPLL